MPSMGSEFRRVSCLVRCIHLCIMCIASCHHAPLFKTHLNKRHESLIHLNRGSSHGEILFITYKSLLLLLGSYYKYSNNLEFTTTHLQNIPCFFLLNSSSPNFALNSFFTFRSSTKNLNIFWTYLSLTSYAKPFELNSNEFDSNFTHIFISIFLGSGSFC